MLILAMANMAEAIEAPKPHPRRSQGAMTAMYLLKADIPVPLH